MLQVDTQQLVEEAYRLGDFAGSVTLLIESQVRAARAPVSCQQSGQLGGCQHRT
jgi:hypothetical protein